MWSTPLNRSPSLFLQVLIAATSAAAFSCNNNVVSCTLCHHPSVPILAFCLSASLDDNIDSSQEGDKELMDDLGWRAERIRLEEENTRAFLKRKPRKLPYEDARKWIQANLGPDTEEEYYDLVANGNLRTPYIPKRPEEYYKETKEWISWDHFLHGIFDGDTPSGLRPPTGAFD